MYSMTRQSEPSSRFKVLVDLAHVGMRDPAADDDFAFGPTGGFDELFYRNGVLGHRIESFIDDTG